MPPHYSRGYPILGYSKGIVGVTFHDALAHETEHWGRPKKRSENAQPQNEILCSRGLGGAALNKQTAENVSVY